jgi:hypothetical protein
MYVIHEKNAHKYVFTKMYSFLLMFTQEIYFSMNIKIWISFVIELHTFTWMDVEKD